MTNDMNKEIPYMTIEPIKTVEKGVFILSYSQNLEKHLFADFNNRKYAISYFDIVGNYCDHEIEEADMRYIVNCFKDSVGKRDYTSIGNLNTALEDKGNRLFLLYKTHQDKYRTITLNKDNGEIRLMIGAYEKIIGLNTETAKLMLECISEKINPDDKQSEKALYDFSIACQF